MQHKHSRQIGEITKNTSREERVTRSNTESESNVDNITENLAYNDQEDRGIRRSKRIPNANRTEKYGAILIGQLKEI